MKKLDLVVPCYNEQECVRLFYEKVSQVVSKIESIDGWKIIFVNDGSKDNTLMEINKLILEYGEKHIKYVSFSRNFGKESAIYAGLSYSTGDYIVLMDADLQHPAEVLPEMVQALDEGYDCCGARRVSREGEPFLRSLLSKMFYRVINHVTSMELVQGGSDFRMMKRPMVDAMLSMQERERFTKGIMSWVGFDTKWIEYENVERVAGATKWSLKSLFSYAMSGFIAFATAPLRIAVWLGFLIDAITLIWGVLYFVVSLTTDFERTGFATIVLLISFFGGTIILLLGIIGEYMARVYMEIKKRPIYIIKDANLPEHNNRKMINN